MIRDLLIELARTGQVLGTAKHGLNPETYQGLLSSCELTEREADAAIAVFHHVMDIYADDDFDEVQFAPDYEQVEEPMYAVGNG